MRALVVFTLLTIAVPALAEDDASTKPVDVTNVGIRPSGGDLGLGLNIGWPTGLAGKWWYSDDQGVAFGVGLGGFSGAGGYVDWVWSPILLHSSPEFAVAPYFGGGAFFGLFPLIYTPFTTAGFFSLGLEVPLGIAVNTGEYPLEIFAELAPGVSVLPHIGVGTRASVGFRWYF